MNRIMLTNVEIIKIWDCDDTPEDPSVTLLLRDVVDSHLIYFQATFRAYAAIIVKQTLTEGNLIDISGNMWIKTCTTQFGEKGYIAVLNNPSEVCKLSLHAYIDLSDKTAVSSAESYQDDDEILPFWCEAEPGEEPYD